MKTVNVSELEGVALDWAVANAVEAWKTAHEQFPTWTLDATFSGVRPMVYSDGQAFCQLTPSNPMRQDPQRYSPSTDWSQGGPLIAQHVVSLTNESSHWSALAVAAGKGCASEFGPTPLVAACLAIAAAHFGDTVEVPEVLL
jgi:hypothetical protein